MKMNDYINDLKKDNQELMLLSGIAGIFFGAFLSK